MFDLLKKLFLKNKNNILFSFLISVFLGFFLSYITSFFFFLIILNIVDLFFLHELFFFEVDEVKQKNFFLIYLVYYLFIFFVFFMMRLTFLFFSCLSYFYDYSHFVVWLETFTSGFLFSFLEFFLLSLIYFFVKKYSINNIRFLFYVCYVCYFNFFSLHLFGLFLKSICAIEKICLFKLLEINFIHQHFIASIYPLTAILIPEIYFYCLFPSIIFWFIIYFLNVLFELNRVKKIRKKTLSVL